MERGVVVAPWFDVCECNNCALHGMKEHEKRRAENTLVIQSFACVHTHRHHDGTRHGMRHGRYTIHGILQSP